MMEMLSVIEVLFYRSQTFLVNILQVRYVPATTVLFSVCQTVYLGKGERIFICHLVYLRECI